ncbi:SRPBCC family protein [Halosegnis sp.]|uniref:SRPBCC family protein n=1 Tax=Halosegnis sp. TaxID=2864959 RepID=UPI0035D3FE4E
MNTVRVERTLAADPEPVRAAIRDVEPFMRAAGFDGVDRDGDTLRLTNHVGIMTLELTLALVDRPDAVLAYEQREGIFESMETTYTVTPTDEGCTVAAETAYALDVGLVGDFLDATVIDRQRRRELTAQFDHLAERFGEPATA